MQGAASIAFVCWLLAGRAFAGLGPAALARPIRIETEIVTFLEPTFSHLKTYRCRGVSVYPIIGGMARWA